MTVVPVFACLISQWAWAVPASQKECAKEKKINKIDEVESKSLAKV